jgi:hypothetical protein
MTVNERYEMMMNVLRYFAGFYLGGAFLTFCLTKSLGLPTLECLRGAVMWLWYISIIIFNCFS